MRATITIRQQLWQELVDSVGTADPTEAVRLAIEGYVRHAKIQRLIALRGRVAVAENDEIESWDVGEVRGG